MWEKFIDSKSINSEILKQFRFITFQILFSLVSFKNNETLLLKQFIRILNSSTVNLAVESLNKTEIYH